MGLSQNKKTIPQKEGMNSHKVHPFCVQLKYENPNCT